MVNDNPIKHSTADNYEHFLAYMHGAGARHNALLCKAYFDGSDAPHEEHEAYMAAHPEPVKPSQLADASLEPVAWMDFHGNVKNNEEINDYIAAGWGKDKAATYSIPLYAAPVQPVKQEPVAMVVSKHGDPESFGERELEVLIDIQALPYDTPFYAAPVSAKREWVDLTDNECLEITKRFALGIAFPVNGVTTPEMFAHAVIAAFKEKNK